MFPWVANRIFHSSTFNFMIEAGAQMDGEIASRQKINAAFQFWPWHGWRTLITLWGWDRISDAGRNTEYRFVCILPLWTYCADTKEQNAGLNFLQFNKPTYPTVCAAQQTTPSDVVYIEIWWYVSFNPAMSFSSWFFSGSLPASELTDWL